MPNLAGLARTCEIFAASSLVVPDARVLKNPAFSKISTGAEQWLPIEELDETQLMAWIRNAKRRGYTLVGVEQTNNSVCLTKVGVASLALPFSHQVGFPGYLVPPPLDSFSFSFFLSFSFCRPYFPLFSPLQGLLVWVPLFVFCLGLRGHVSLVCLRCLSLSRSL